MMLPSLLHALKLVLKEAIAEAKAGRQVGTTAQILLWSPIAFLQCVGSTFCHRMQRKGEESFPKLADQHLQYFVAVSGPTACVSYSSESTDLSTCKMLCEMTDPE
jgi:cytochrome c553